MRATVRAPASRGELLNRRGNAFDKLSRRAAW